MPQQLRRTGLSDLYPVTALAFYRYRHAEVRMKPGGGEVAASETSEESPSLLVLAGEDGWLAVYRAWGSNGELDTDHIARPKAAAGTATAQPGQFARGCCYGRLRIFAEQAIQGFRMGPTGGRDKGPRAKADDEDGDILVWGGRSVALVTRGHIAQLIGAASPWNGNLEDEQEEDAATRPPRLHAVDEVVAPDWIYDGLLPRAGTGEGDDVGALITAHNEVIPFRVGAAPSRVLTLFDVRISPSRPMLYSAHLAWLQDGETSTAHASGTKDDGQLLVAAGTVFGEIVAWTCQLQNAGRHGHAQSACPEPTILQVFSGHEGSIFDVAVSPELLLNLDWSKATEGSLKRRVRLLATCSDDRTIRIWPLQLDGSVSGTGESKAQPLLDGARETGFQNTFENTDLPQGPSGPLSPSPPSAALATVMAHASRIWHVRFGGRDGNSYSVYSFGEDATAQEWRLDLSESLPQTKTETSLPELSGELVHLRTLSPHTGKNIWSAAVSTNGPRGPLVATGGCDGMVCLFRSTQSQPSDIRGDGLSRFQTDKVLACSTVPQIAVQKGEQNDGSPPTAAKGGQLKTRADVFNSYAFLSESELFAVTTHGRLLLGRLLQHGGSAASLSWAELDGIPESVVSSLKNYNVVRSPLSSGGGSTTAPNAAGMAFIGNAAGQLFIFSVGGGLQELTSTLPGKVDGIFFLPHAKDPFSNEKRSPGSLQLQVLATTLFRDEATLIDLDIDTLNGTLTSERRRTLKLPTKSPASPSYMTITAASRCLHYIVLGSRSGQLCLYEPVSTTYALVSQIQTRTRDAILSIVPLPPKSCSTPSSASFVVTARDGTYRIYGIVDADNAAIDASPTIRLQHETATPFGPIVRDAWFIDGESPKAPPELILCGFRSTSFVVWNETRQREITTVECGGTHRMHTYLFGGHCGKGRVRFAFTRHSELHMYAQDVCAIWPLKRGGHGREIRATSASASGMYLATGGEDTVVRIWANPAAARTDDTAEEWRCLSVLKLHNTGLHSLVWLGDDCLVSAAGSEELYVWRITTIRDSAYDGLAVLCESAYPDSTSDKILRITGLDVTADLEDKGSMFVSVALSNSVLKTYRYTADHGRDSWRLLSQGMYTGACPTQLRHLQLCLGEKLVVLAAYADGSLCVWGATPVSPSAYDEYSLLCATSVHRNAIKALDLYQTAPQSTFSIAESQSEQAEWTAAIFTGGDDSAIAVTTLGRAGSEDKGEYAFGKTFRVSRAHAAAVTGVRVLKDAAKTGSLGWSFTAVSCSNDQRVKAWTVFVADARANGTSSPVHVQLVDNRYSAIADPGDVENTGGQGEAWLVVVGMGMETWTLK